jgi:hypothetical protein
MQAGDAIVFSGSHLHGTIVGRQGTERLSADFRTVNVRHHEQDEGARNIDTRCVGSNLRDLIAWKLPPAPPAFKMEQIAPAVG